MLTETKMVKKTIVKLDAQETKNLYYLATITSDEPGRYGLNSVYLDGRNLVATDDRRLAVAKIKRKAKESILIPADLIKLAKKAKFKTMSVCTNNDTILVLDSGDNKVVTSVRDDGFPEYERIIAPVRKDSHRSLVIDRAKLATHIRATQKTLAKQKSELFHEIQATDKKKNPTLRELMQEIKKDIGRNIDLVFKDGIVSINATDKKRWMQTFAAMDASAEDDITFTFNVKYLLELLKTPGTSKDIVIKYKNNLSPVLVAGARVEHILCPVRVNNRD